MKAPSGATLLAAFLLAGCQEDDSVVAGRPAGSETSEEIAARILDSEGRPVPEARILLRPTWFVADSLDPDRSFPGWETTTTPEGRFRLESPPIGHYRLEVRGVKSGLVVQLERSTGIPSLLGDLRIRPTGWMKGRVLLPPGTSRAWVQIHGLQRGVPTTSSGTFLLQGIPQGTSPLSLRVVASGVPLELGATLASLPSSGFADLDLLPPPRAEDEDLRTWRHSTPVQAMVARTILSNPSADPVVALVRLDPTRFDFNLAQRDGKDVRFTDSSGNLLPHWIHSWDRTDSVARVFVRLPSAGPSDSQPTLLLHSGRGEVPSRSDSLAVWSGIPDASIQAATSFVVDDFETPSPRSDLPLDLPVGNWVLSASGTARLVHPVAVASEWTTAIAPAGAGRTGSAMRIRWTPGDSTNADYIVVATPLSPRPQVFRSLDSLVIRLRGNGYVFVALEGPLSSGRKAWTRVTLDSIWVRYTIRPEDFAPAGSGGSTGWLDTRDQVRRLTLIAYHGTELWIDDISIHGLGVDEMR